MKLREGIPEQFRNKPYIETLLSAFDDELAELAEVFEQLKILRTFEFAAGEQLDGIGDIVVMDRKTAAELTLQPNAPIDDMYRTILKYKALKNTTDCRIEDFYNACDLIYYENTVYYREIPERPATMFVDMLVPKFNEYDIELLSKAGLIIKPGGVALKIHVAEEDCFFGFINLNSKAKGFGVGKFAIDCSKGGLVT